MSKHEETKMSDNLKDYYKVPFRQVYCETFLDWIVATLRCHVWLRIRP